MAEGWLHLFSCTLLRQNIRNVYGTEAATKCEKCYHSQQLKANDSVGQKLGHSNSQAL